MFIDISQKILHHSPTKQKNVGSNNLPFMTKTFSKAIMHSRGGFRWDERDWKRLKINCAPFSGRGFFCSIFLSSNKMLNMISPMKIWKPFQVHMMYLLQCSVTLSLLNKMPKCPSSAQVLQLLECPSVFRVPYVCLSSVLQLLFECSSRSRVPFECSIRVPRGPSNKKAPQP